MLSGTMSSPRVRSRIHLMGGGPGTMLALRSHLKSALAEAVTANPKKKPLVAYVGAASGDHLGFQHMIGAVLAAAGARVQGVKLASPKANVSAARTLLEDSDAIFVSGGDVELGMSVLQDRGVLPLFHTLVLAGKPIIGISAGSIMLGRAWVRFPEEKVGVKALGPSVFPCMGLAPVYVDAHAEDEEWGELRVLLHLVAQSGENRPVGYGLTRKGGLTLEPSDQGTNVVAFGTDAPRFVARGGKVLASDSLRVGTSEPANGPEERPRRGPAAR
jgi:hypothetical protein